MLLVVYWVGSYNRGGDVCGMFVGGDLGTFWRPRFRRDADGIEHVLVGGVDDALRVVWIVIEFTSFDD